MVRIQSPGKDPSRSRGFQRFQQQQKTSSPEQRTYKSKPTYECYNNPRGPDIKPSNLGPEHKQSQYQYKEYKPKAITPYRPRLSSPKDPLRSKPSYADKPVDMYKGDVTYRLKENNNAAMRHWNYGFVNDTVAANRSYPKPRNEYTVLERPKPRQEYKKPTEAKPERRPEVAAVLPAQTRQSTHPVTPPAKKSYKTTTTQTQVSKTKTLGTQYQPEKTKTLPVVAPLPIPQPSRKVSTKAQGTQCSESPKKTSVKGTQSTGPKVRVSNTQTSPAMITTQQHRTATPQYAEQTKQETPVYRRRSPSPELLPIIAPVQTRLSPTKRRTPTPKQVTPAEARWTPSPEVVETAPISTHAYTSPQTYQQRNTETPFIPDSPPTQTIQHPKSSKLFIPPIEPQPEVASYPDYSASEITYRSGHGLFPYQTSNSRLPPEVTACIEAYDIAHGPI